MPPLPSEPPLGVPPPPLSDPPLGVPPLVLSLVTVGFFPIGVGSSVEIVNASSPGVPFIVLAASVCLNCVAAFPFTVVDIAELTPAPTTPGVAAFVATLLSVETGCVTVLTTLDPADFKVETGCVTAPATVFAPLTVPCANPFAP